MIGFIEFPKIARLSREVVITEKIDGTNASIYIGEDGEFLTGSRSQWITSEKDNYGFARWANEHKEELLKLGTGHHFGEWWGSGVQRGYGLEKGEKRFSLFNTGHWVKFNGNPILKEKQEYCPDCCYVVPVIYTGMFDTLMIESILINLKEKGSLASPGFMRPEGVVIYHTAARISFKKTIEKDEVPKSLTPTTYDGIHAYLEEADKRIKYLKPFVNELNRLKTRIKACKNRLDKHILPPGGK